MVTALVVVLLVWSITTSVVLFRVIEGERKDRAASQIRYMQAMGSARAEVQALTEALARAQGGMYLSPISRARTGSEKGVPTESWFQTQSKTPVMFVKSEDGK